MTQNTSEILEAEEKLRGYAVRCGVIDKDDKLWEALLNALQTVEESEYDFKDAIYYNHFLRRVKFARLQGLPYKNIDELDSKTVLKILETDFIEKYAQNMGISKGPINSSLFGALRYNLAVNDFNPSKAIIRLGKSRRLNEVLSSCGIDAREAEKTFLTKKLSGNFNTQTLNLAKERAIVNNLIDIDEEPSSVLVENINEIYKAQDEDFNVKKAIYKNEYLRLVYFARMNDLDVKNGLMSDLLEAEDYMTYRVACQLSLVDEGEELAFDLSRALRTELFYQDYNYNSIQNGFITTPHLNALLSERYPDIHAELQTNRAIQNWGDALEGRHI